MESSIAAVVILYNFNIDVINNIETYSKYVDLVILVDNSDSEFYYDKYKTKLEKYKYISMNGNCGIARALNVGIEYANKNGYNWVLTMDQDSRFTKNLIDIYISYLNKMNDDEIIILSPNYVYDRKKTIKYEGIKKIEYTMQSGNLLNISLFNKVGKFKENFFIDCVDYEYCLRANEKGYKIFEVGNAILEHTPAITKKFLFVKYGYCNPIRIYYQVRNLLWTSNRYKKLKLKLIVFYKLFKIIFFYDHKKEFLKMFIKGVSDYKKNRFGGYMYEKK